MNQRTLREIEEGIGERHLHAEVMVPLTFQGMTTKLVISFAKSSDLAIADVTKSLLEKTDEWNEHVRQGHSEWISVKDTMLGLTWLEGIDEEHGVVFFGYLEHITEHLLLGNVSNKTHFVPLRTRNETVCDIMEKKKFMKRDELELVRELFESVDMDLSIEKFSVKDIARYTLSGGFSSHFRVESPRHFLIGTAETRGYWSTLVVCRPKRIQIRFKNAKGEFRIAQRASKLEAYAGIGFVDPRDELAVYSVSKPCYDEKKRNFMLLYWEDMDDTTTREELCKKFGNSSRESSDGMILGVDMTVGEIDAERQLIRAEN